MIEVVKDSLSHRAIRGGFWVFSLRITERFFYIARLIILARILEPKDFGMLGIAMLTLMTLENFSQTGFEAAIIQKKDGIDTYLDSAWTMGIIRGVILFTVIWFAAPYVALFFEAIKATSIIRVLGLSFFIKSFTNIGVIYFKKELEFNKQYIYQLSGVLVDFSVALLLALMLKSVWALVFGILAGNLVRLVSSYFMHSYRPRLNVDIAKIIELFRYGKWVLGSSILVFLVTQGDDILVGKMLGVTFLGFYQMAYRISNMPTTEITHVISQVTFPAFSKLQDNLSNLKIAYLKVLQLTTFLSFPLSGLILVLAPDFTTIFLGEKWLPMVPALQILVLAGLTRSVAASSGFLLYAIGKPKIDTILQVIRLIVLVIFIYPFTAQWGITGSSFAVLFSVFIVCIGFSAMAIKTTKCGLLDYSRIIIVPLINSIIALLSILLLKTFLIEGIYTLLFLPAAGLLIYFVITYLFDHLTNYRMYALLLECRHFIKGG